MIYSYLNQSKPTDDPARAEVVQFIRAMYALKDELQCQEFYVSPKQRATLMNPSFHELRVVPLNDLMGQYFTFMRRECDVGHPIYITLKPAERAARFRAISRMIWDERGLVACRVTAPGQERAGNMVVTARTRREQDEIVDLIGTDYDRHKHAYDHRIPKLTHPVRSMTGVSVGIQPPQTQIIGGSGTLYAKDRRMSFGAYRAQIVFLALDQSEYDVGTIKSLYYYKKFKERAAEYFAIAGIDVYRPWNQAEPVKLQPYEIFNAKLAKVKRRDFSRKRNKETYEFRIKDEENFYLDPANDPEIERMGKLAAAKYVRDNVDYAPDL